MQKVPHYEGPGVQGFISTKQECNKIRFTFFKILANCCWAEAMAEVCPKAKNHIGTCAAVVQEKRGLTRRQ